MPLEFETDTLRDYPLKDSQKLLRGLHLGKQWFFFQKRVKLQFGQE